MNEEMMKEARAHVFVSGRVQGVFFRHSARVRAEELGLAGWVKNTRDGRVELVAEGPREQVEALVRWCHQGPPGAQVGDVEVSWEEPVGLQSEGEGFRVAGW